MKRFCLSLGTLVFTGLIALATPAHAQSAATIFNPAAPRYDSAKEVTLDATVAVVAERAPHGSQRSSRVRLETSAGTVNGSFGRFIRYGKNAPSIKPGQRLRVTGVMVSRNSSNLFLVRTLQVDGHLYTLRDENGRYLRHPAGNDASKHGSKGGLR
jgi:hypothetical protein